MKNIILAILFLISFNSFAQIPVELFQLLDEKDTTSLYFGAEKDPEFPGGHNAYVNFLQKKFYYPTIARQTGAQGKVFVMFIVEKNGKITNVKATNSVNKHLEKAAVRLVKKMPNWIPGEQDDQIVRVLHVLPINFKLE
ncbi:MAG: energy transducer TonB [Fulvivirga sp.]